MRLLLLLLFVTNLATQSPLTTTYQFGSGGASGGATYWELEVLDPAGLTIHQIDLNLQGSGGIASTLDVYLQPLPGPGTLDHDGVWYGPFASTTVSSNVAGTPTPFVLSSPIELGAGCRYGIASVCTNGQSYAPPGLPLYYATNELELLSCCASNQPFTGSVFSDRTINTSIHYTSGGSCPAIAQCDSVGGGCVTDPGAFYELVDPTSFDLSGWRLVGTATPSGYDVTLVPGGGFAPSPTATPLALPDDGSIDTASVGGTLGLFVGSNCWLARGDGNSNNFQPNPSAMLANPATGIYSWTDFDPTAPNSGSVYYEEIGTVAIVTYDGVFGWGTTAPNEVEIRYDVASGDFSIEWGITSSSNPENWLVGFSLGGPTPDPGNTDISASAPFSFAVEAPLQLACVQRPIQDPSISTAFTVQTTGLRADAQIHVGMIGFATVPVGLGLLGLPADCTLYLSPVALYPQVLAPAAGLLAWSPITLPAQSAATYAGFTFRLQAATLAVGGFVEARISNALSCVVGSQ